MSVCWCAVARPPRDLAAGRATSCTGREGTVGAEQRAVSENPSCFAATAAGRDPQTADRLAADHAAVWHWLREVVCCRTAGAENRGVTAWRPFMLDASVLVRHRRNDVVGPGHGFSVCYGWKRNLGIGHTPRYERFRMTSDRYQSASCIWVDTRVILRGRPLSGCGRWSASAVRATDNADTVGGCRRSATDLKAGERSGEHR